MCNQNNQGGEMAWGLVALAVLTGDPGSVPSLHTVAHKPPVTPAPADPMPTSGLLSYGTQHTCCAHTIKINKSLRCFFFFFKSVSGSFRGPEISPQHLWSSTYSTYRHIAIKIIKAKSKSQIFNKQITI